MSASRQSRRLSYAGRGITPIEGTTGKFMTKKKFLVWLYVSELFLVVLSLFVAKLSRGAFLDFPIDINGNSFILGIVAVIPAVGMLVLLTYGPVSRILRVRQAMEGIIERLRSVLGESINALTWVDIVLLSIAAGIGEELLFRGILQPYIGIILASLVFGLLHAMTTTYFIFATAIGIYLGVIFQYTGNLFVPMLTHAVYDIVALTLLKRMFEETNASS